MMNYKHFILILTSSLVTILIGIGTAFSHEPIFGIGPHTIHKYGIGLETEFEGGNNDRELHFEVIFGVTEDLSLTASLPYRIEEEKGLSNLLLRGKWRFYRNDGMGGSNQAAIVFGIRTPGLDQGPDSFGYLLAATIGREARREYFFSGLRYMLNTADESGFKPGDVFKYDLAVGIRPFPGAYESPDLVLLLELNGTYIRKPTFPTPSAGSGNNSGSGNKIGIGPGLIFSYRNVMFKAGLDFIILQESERVPLGDNVESVFAVEVHLSPFSFIYGR